MVGHGFALTVVLFLYNNRPVVKYVLGRTRQRDRKFGDAGAC